MGLFSGLLGNASKKDNDKVERQLEGILIPGEQVELAYVLVRDLIVFTEKRLILVDKQGVTGKKKDFTTLPYSKIQLFSVETAGILDLDSELDLYYSGIGLVKFEFTGESDIVNIARIIGEYLL